MGVRVDNTKNSLDVATTSVSFVESILNRDREMELDFPQLLDGYSDHCEEEALRIPQGTQFGGETVKTFMGQVSLLKSPPLRIYANNLAFSALPLDTCLDWTSMDIYIVCYQLMEIATADFITAEDSPETLIKNVIINVKFSFF
ncbi:hypothetical protein Tco_0710301 [Tanacetum coccineum]